MDGRPRLGHLRRPRLRPLRGDPGRRRRQIHLEGGPAPVRRFLPELIERIQSGEIQPGRVFTARMPLDDAAEAYRAMDERREIKVLLEV